MESFYRKRVGTRKLLAKEKDCSRRAHFLRGRQGILLYTLRGGEFPDDRLSLD